MAWLYLVAAGVFEVAFAFCLGKIKATPSAALGWVIGFLVCMAGSLGLLSRSLAQIPLGTAYAVWTGIGAAGTVLLGMLVFHDPATGWRLFFLATLVGSLVGLKLVSQ